jgi:hypothetical protein
VLPFVFVGDELEEDAEESWDAWERSVEEEKTWPESQVGRSPMHEVDEVELEGE